MKRLISFASALMLSLSSLMLINFGSVLAAGTYTCTWTGAGDGTSFSDATNWSGCNSAAPVPGDSDDLVFDSTGLSNFDLNNDLTNAFFSSITFQGSGGSFLIDGNSFTLLSGGIDDGGQDFDEIDNDITLSGTVPVTGSGGQFLTLAGALSGSGALTKSGAGELLLDGDNSSYTGAITVNAGTLDAGDPNALATSGGTTINDGASLFLDSCANATFAGNLTLTGVSSDTTGDIPVAKLTSGAACGGGGGGETYGYPAESENITISGNITLGSDVTFAPAAATSTLTGNVSGAHKINLVQGYGGKLVVQAGSNTSQTSNGTYTSPVYTKTVSDSQPSTTVKVDGNTVLTIDGTRGNTTVGAGATLKGTGTVGTLSVATNGTVAEGHSPGCMNTGNLTLNGNLDEEIGGNTACTDYDQLKVTGTVNVSNGTLNTSLYNNYKPKANETYTIIDNDGSDAVTGTLTGLAEGATFNLGGNVFKISYVGGTGNDVVLTVVSVPATPNTGFAMITNNPLAALLGTSLAACGILTIARRYNQFAKEQIK